MRTIALTQGKLTKVDDCDYKELSKYKWMAANSRGFYYAVRWDNSVFPRKQIKMHRQILGINDPKIWIDHEDGDTLNNTRKNIRIATPKQNAQNRKAFGKSKYRGVYPQPSGMFRAGIIINKKYKHLGNFKNEEDAARAWDEAAKKLHGEFAKLNFR